MIDRLEQVEELLSHLSDAEKAQVLQWIVRELGDAFPGIASDPLVSGGDPCVVRTRIPVWLLVHLRRLGTTEAELLTNYPALRSEDLANVWAYARLHRADIDAQIAEHQAA